MRPRRCGAAPDAAGAQELQAERASGHNEIAIPFLRELRSVCDTADITFTSYQEVACPQDEDRKRHAREPEEETLVRDSLQ